MSMMETDEEKTFLQSLSERLLDKLFRDGIDPSSLNKTDVFSLFEVAVHALNEESVLRQRLIANLPSHFDLLWRSLERKIPVSFTGSKRAPESIVEKTPQKRRKTTTAAAAAAKEEISVPNIFTAKGISFTQSEIESDLNINKTITPFQIDLLSRTLVDQDFPPTVGLDLMLKGIQHIAAKKDQTIAPTKPTKRTPSRNSSSAPASASVPALQSLKTSSDNLQHIIHLFYPHLCSLSSNTPPDQLLLALQHGIDCLKQITEAAEKIDQEGQISKVDWDSIVRKISSLIALASGTPVSETNKETKQSLIHFIALSNALIFRFDRNEDHIFHLRSLGCNFAKQFSDRLLLVFLLLKELRDQNVDINNLSSKPKIIELLVSVFTSSSSVNFQPFASSSLASHSNKSSTLFLQFMIVAKQTIKLLEGETALKKTVMQAVDRFGVSDDLSSWLSRRFLSDDGSKTSRDSLSLRLLKDATLTISILEASLQKAEAKRDLALSTEDETLFEIDSKGSSAE